jgi:hypothetical protein
VVDEGKPAPGVDVDGRPRTAELLGPGQHRSGGLA